MQCTQSPGIPDEEDEGALLTECAVSALEDIGPTLLLALLETMIGGGGQQQPMGSCCASVSVAVSAKPSREPKNWTKRIGQLLCAVTFPADHIQSGCCRAHSACVLCVQIARQMSVEGVLVAEDSLLEEEETGVREELLKDAEDALLIEEEAAGTEVTEDEIPTQRAHCA